MIKEILNVFSESDQSYADLIKNIDADRLKAAIHPTNKFRFTLEGVGVKISPEQQEAALAFGLRPANANIPVDASEESLFVKWQEQGVQDVVPRTSAMRSPDREVLLTLLRWFELNGSN